MNPDLSENRQGLASVFALLTLALTCAVLEWDGPGPGWLVWSWMGSFILWATIGRYWAWCVIWLWAIFGGA